MGVQLKDRANVAIEDTWKLEDMFQDDQQWEEAFSSVDEQCAKLKEKNGTVLKDGSSLYDFLQCYEQTGTVLETLYVYANQKYHQDTTNGVYQGMADRASSLLIKFQSAISFFKPQVLEMDEQDFQQIFDECKKLATPQEVVGYERFFEEILRQKQHSLSAELEEVMADVKEVMDAPDAIFSIFNNADLTFPSLKDEKGETVTITHGSYQTLLKSRDRNVRKEAFQGLYSRYEEFKNTLATTYGANVKKDVFYAKTRKYPSSLAMALDGSHIPLEVYENLIGAVRESLPLLHRYMSLRKKALGVEELHMYDVYVPIVEENTEKIPFSRAKEMVLEGLQPMGEEYVSLLKKGMQERWIDVYENKGKKSGAYSWGSYGTHPYVLLNHQEDINSVFTLAHEMGHALHSYYSNHAQPYFCADYEIFVAEVASTCNEALLIHHLLEETTDPKQRAYLLNYYLEQFRTTLFRQTMFAEFEWKAHEMAEKGEALTAERLCAMYHQLNADYFGGDTVIDPEIDMEWARIPHFYRSFYVYQYATGYSAAIALSSKILTEGESAARQYIDAFLRGGGSKDPIDLLKAAGVDMSKKESIQSALEVFSELLDQMESCVQ